MPRLEVVPVALVALDSVLRLSAVGGDEHERDIPATRSACRKARVVGHRPIRDARAVGPSAVGNGVLRLGEGSTKSAVERENTGVKSVLTATR